MFPKAPHIEVSHTKSNVYLKMSLDDWNALKGYLVTGSEMEGVAHTCIPRERTADRQNVLGEEEPNQLLLKYIQNEFTSDDVAEFERWRSESYENLTGINGPIDELNLDVEDVKKAAFTLPSYEMGGVQNRVMAILIGKKAKYLLKVSVANRLNSNPLVNFLLIKRGLMLPYVRYFYNEKTYTITTYIEGNLNGNYAPFLVSYLSDLRGLNEELSNEGIALVDKDVKWDQIAAYQKRGVRSDFEFVEVNHLNAVTCSQAPDVPVPLMSRLDPDTVRLTKHDVENIILILKLKCEAVTLLKREQPEMLEELLNYLQAFLRMHEHMLLSFESLLIGAFMVLSFSAMAYRWLNASRNLSTDKVFHVPHFVVDMNGVYVTKIIYEPGFTYVSHENTVITVDRKKEITTASIYVERGRVYQNMLKYTDLDSYTIVARTKNGFLPVKIFQSSPKHFVLDEHTGEAQDISLPFDP